MAAGGGIATVQGTPPGAAPPLAAQPGRPGDTANGVLGGSAFPSSPLGGTRNAGGDLRPVDTAKGVLSGSALPGGPLGGTRNAGASAADLHPVRSTSILGAGPNVNVSEDRHLSRSSGLGGPRTDSIYGAGLNDRADATAMAKDQSNLSRGRPPGSSLPPIGQQGLQRIPGAVSGPGAAPAAPPASEQASAFTQRTVPNTPGQKEQTGLFSEVDGSFKGIPAGTTDEGYQVFMSQDGTTWWAQTDAGWTQVGDINSESSRSANWSVANHGNGTSGQGRGGGSSAYGQTSSGQHAGTGQSPPPAAPPPGGQTASSDHGLSANQPTGQSSGVSDQAVALGKTSGQDPALIQWLLDNGVSPGQITKEGVTGIDDPDFAGGDAEWDDMYDPEAGLLFRAGQEYRNQGSASRDAQAQEDASAAFAKLLQQLQGMQAPGIDPAALEGLLRTQQQMNMGRQSQALASTLADAGAAGLSAGAATGLGSRMLTDFANNSALQEGQLRMQGALANLPGQQQKFGAVAGAMGLPAQLAAQRAGTSNQASIQAQLMQLQQQLGWSDAEFQQNMQDGFLDYLGGILGGAVNGAAAGLGGAAGSKLSTYLFG